MPHEHGSARGGLLLGVTAYLLWGGMPLYFKALAHVSSVEIVAHRIIWSLAFLAVLVSLWRRWGAIRTAFAAGRVVTTLVVTSLLIAVNWLTYIYAVVSGHVLEGSLGYYLNPLVNVLLGVVLLKERLSAAQIFATGLAAVGVAVLAVGAGSGLWISLTLAASFGLYGFVRKVAPVDSLEGLTIETAILFPVAAGWLFWMNAADALGFGRFGTTTDLLLALGGVITAVPLLLFTAAARRLPYSTLGFLQYIAPSLQFLLAVLAFGEPMTTAHMTCFGAIWTALAIFTVDGFHAARRRRAASGSSSP